MNTPNSTLNFVGIVEQSRETFHQFPDYRKSGDSTRYTLEDAGLSVFSVFLCSARPFLDINSGW